MPRPTGLIQQLDQHLHRFQILARREHILIGCSGGADSVALVHLLHAVSQSNYWQWKLRLVHINHQTRPGENELDDALVRQLARQLRIPLSVARLRPSSHTRTEAELRQLRWNKFHAVASRFRCTCIVTAHHADDQAETVLMRLLRGAGVNGLGAIHPVRRHASIKVVRPVLHIRKKQLVEYLTSHSIPWREDASNTDIHHLRNRIRQEILPALAGCQPQVVLTLVKTAAQMRSVQRIINRQVKQLRDELHMRGFAAPKTSLDRSILRHTDTIILLDFLRRWLAALGVSADQLGYRKLEDIRHHIRQQKSGLTIILSDTEHIYIRQHDVRFRRTPKRHAKAGL